MTASLAGFEATLRRLGGDQDLFQDLVRFFFEDSPGLLDQLRSAIFQQNADAIERAAHRLKGLISNFDVPLPTDTAMRIEQMGRSCDFQGAANALPTFEKSLRQLSDLLTPFCNREQ
jgi:HPt (histidine-containing phosphotransfer) domain-containing protein